MGRLTETEAQSQENKRTRQYMEKYGLQKARGDQYSYSGDYVKIGGYYLTSDDWFVLKSSLLVMVSIVFLSVAYLLK